MSICGPSDRVRFFLAKTNILIDVQSCIVNFAGCVNNLERKYGTTKMTDIVLDARLDVVGELSE